MSSVYDKPSEYIKTPNEMGITGKGDSASIDITLDALKEYNNALYSDNTTALKIDNKKKPLGNRYFAKVNGVYNEKGEKTDRYVSVDNMKYTKDVDRRFNLKNTGLIYSAKATIDGINPYAILNSDKLVEVEIETNAKGDTASQKIGIGDYKRMDCTAFPNKCKKYKGQTKCEPCFVKENMDGMNNSNKPRNSIHHCTDSKKDDDYSHYIYDMDLYDEEEIMSLMNKISRYISIFYLGSLTLVGLYIIYRLIQKQK
jgi:hypothetical protein